MPEGQRTFDPVVWFDEQARNDVQVIRETLIRTPSDTRVPLGSVADADRDYGPNTINRENVVRRIVAQASRDLVSVVEDIQAAVGGEIVPGLPTV